MGKGDKRISPPTDLPPSRPSISSDGRFIRSNGSKNRDLFGEKINFNSALFPNNLPDNEMEEDLPMDGDEPSVSGEPPGDSGNPSVNAVPLWHDRRELRVPIGQIDDPNATRLYSEETGRNLAAESVVLPAIPEDAEHYDHDTSETENHRVRFRDTIAEFDASGRPMRIFDEDGKPLARAGESLASFNEPGSTGAACNSSVDANVAAEVFGPRPGETSVEEEESEGSLPLHLRTPVTGDQFDTTIENTPMTVSSDAAAPPDAMGVDGELSDIRAITPLELVGNEAISAANTQNDPMSEANESRESSDERTPRPGSEEAETWEDF
jgi:hypothetical protein